MKKRNTDRDYINDKELTDELLKEIEEFKEGKRKGASEYLGEAFLKTFNKIMTKHSYRNYSEDWRQDFLSKASYLFARHWYKFNPTKQQKNYFQKDGKKYLKEEKDWLGAHNWFTLFCVTAIHDIIREKKKEKENLENLKSLSDEKFRNNLRIF